MSFFIVGCRHNRQDKLRVSTDGWDLDSVEIVVSEDGNSSYVYLTKEDVDRLTDFLVLIGFGTKAQIINEPVEIGDANDYTVINSQISSVNSELSSLSEYYVKLDGRIRNLEMRLNSAADELRG